MALRVLRQVKEFPAACGVRGSEGWLPFVRITLYPPPQTPVKPRAVLPTSWPEFYFGFVGVGLAWQVAFLVIASDPARYRPMIVPAMLEKLTFSCAVAVLHAQGRMSTMQAVASSPDALFFLLFLVAYFKTRPAAGSSRPPIPMNVRIP